MTTPLSSLTHLSDDALVVEVKELAKRERDATGRLVASLAELDARRLYLAEGCSSLFAYCTSVLHLSEHAAYGRIEAARAVHRFPLILDLLTDGSINLTTIGLLAPHLTGDNHCGLLEAARHKTKRQVEELVATLHPRPDVPPTVRKVPVPKARPAPIAPIEPARSLFSTTSLRCEDVPSAKPCRTVPDAEFGNRSGQTIDTSYSRLASQRPLVTPLASDRYKVQFTISLETYEKLRQIQDLLRHMVPNGDLSLIFDRALTLLLAVLSKRKLGAACNPTSVSDRGRIHGTSQHR